MGEIEKQAEIKIRRQIDTNKIMLNNLSKNIMNKSNKKVIENKLKEEIKIWKNILKNYKKSVYKV